MIKSIDIRDFSKFDKFSAKFENGTNVITGEMGSGKSSVGAAVEVLLTGLSSRKDVDEYIRNSFDAAPLLTGEVGTHVIKRGLKPNTLEMDGTPLKLGKSKDRDGLYDYGFRRNVLAILCSSNRFFELKPVEQNDVLAAFFAGDEDIDLKAVGLAPEHHKDLVGLKMSNIKEYHKRIYENRATINKVISDTKAIIKQIVNVPAESLADIILKISELEKEERAIPYGMAPSKPVESAKAVSDEAVKKYESKHRDEYNDIAAALKAINGILDTIGKHTGKCPLSAGKIKCESVGLTEYAEAQKKTKSEFMAKLAAISENEITEEKEFQAKKAKTISVLETQMKAEFDVWKEKCAVFEATAAANRERRDEINKEIQQLVLAKGEIISAQSQLDRQKVLSDALPATEGNASRLTFLLNWLDKDLKAKLTAKSAGGFFQMVNSVSERFGFKISALDGDLARLRINGKTSSMLSTGERIFCGVALQIAVAKESGYNFIIADNMEAAAPGAVTKLLARIESDYPEITFIFSGLNFATTIAETAYDKRSIPFSETYNYIVLGESEALPFDEPAPKITPKEEIEFEG